LKDAIDLAHLNAAGAPERQEIFRAVCHSRKWASELSQSAPYQSLADLRKKSADAWSRCDKQDWMEALGGHPRIGEKAAGSDLASKWSRGEQSKAATADEALKAELLAKQVAYEKKFGFIFLICASGRSSLEILAALDHRMEQQPDAELQTVAQELGKIIQLRLEKLLEP
jgi:2-oxo-4-hydroxy-4-carboxy-5-ureidoimidazoline decarboxylase